MIGNLAYDDDDDEHEQVCATYCFIFVLGNNNNNNNINNNNNNALLQCWQTQYSTTDNSRRTKNWTTAATQDSNCQTQRFGTQAFSTTKRNS